MEQELPSCSHSVFHLVLKTRLLWIVQCLKNEKKKKTRDSSRATQLLHQTEFKSEIWIYAKLKYLTITYDANYLAECKGDEFIF